MILTYYILFKILKSSADLIFCPYKAKQRVGGGGGGVAGLFIYKNGPIICPSRVPNVPLCYLSIPNNTISVLHHLSTIPPSIIISHYFKNIYQFTIMVPWCRRWTSRSEICCSLSSRPSSRQTPTWRGRPHPRLRPCCTGGGHYGTPGGWGSRYDPCRSSWRHDGVFSSRRPTAGKQEKEKN